MKKTVLCFVLVVLALCSCNSLDNPDSTSVAEAKNQRDGRYVQLTGTIERAISQNPTNEWFEFSDSSGSILVEIEDDVWARAGIDWTALTFPDSTYEIVGEVEKERNQDATIEVERIKKL